MTEKIVLTKEDRKNLSTRAFDVSSCSLSLFCDMSSLFIRRPFSTECRTLHWFREFVSGEAGAGTAFHIGFDLLLEEAEIDPHSQGRRKCDVWQVLLRHALLYQNFNTVHNIYK